MGSLCSLISKGGIFVHTAWEAVRGEINRGYGYLPPEMVKRWATDQANLSELYAKKRIAGTSKNPEWNERKRKMMQGVVKTLISRSDLSLEEREVRIKQVEEHLEDPGLLLNFEYFDVPGSDFMLKFYFAVWDRRIAEVMDYLHNYGRSLGGKVGQVPKGDIWFQMSYFEGMNINERKKAQEIVRFIENHELFSVTSFGGGNIPERHYGLMFEVEDLTVFDDGPVNSLWELFPYESERKRVRYIREPLSEAVYHQELHGTQDLVWMHGVSMYLDEKEKHQMTGAIFAGALLLKNGGYMKYDYLLWTESMRRVIKTQNWPYDPQHPMVIFDSVDSAILAGRTTLRAVNNAFGGKVFMDVTEIKSTLVEPWGVTSVRFTVQKHTLYEE